VEAETMESNSDKSDWLDFKSIKARADVHPVLEHFGILEHLEERGAELVGWCPFGKEHGKADSFAFNVEKRSFQCFACKARGSVLDFIGKYRGVGLRDAAKIALDILGEGDTATPQAEKRPAAKGRPYGKPDHSPVRPPAKEPEARRETKRETPQEETAGLPFFGWDHAQFLVESEMLDPARLVVLDVAGLETFLKVTAKKSEEKTG
jgi:hypothetical protein